MPMAQQVAQLATEQRYEEAASVRDEAERLHHLVERQRGIESLRRAGRLTLEIVGEGTVVLEAGVLVDSWAVPGVDTSSADHDSVGQDDERRIVAQWLRAHAGWVRIIEVGAEEGLSMPAERVPTLPELCRAVVRADRAISAGSAA
jgi:hypothetical protein